MTTGYHYNRTKRRHRLASGAAFVGMGILALLGVVAFGGGTALYETGTHSTQTCIVQSKDRVITQNGSDARVYTDCGVFQVADSVWNGQFDAADQYGMLAEGSVYELTRYGFRVPLLSLFPVIIDAVKVP